jgi:predicted MPP superfamily phosphohydrolase
MGGLEQMIKEVKRNEKFLFMSDTHNGFQDKRAVDLVLQVAKDKKPKNIIFGGDMIDAYIASSFGKDFSRLSIQDEVDTFVEDIYKPLLKSCPKSRFYYLDGNHEARMSSRAMDTPAFQKLRVLEFGNILNESCVNAGVKTMLYDTELEIRYKGKPIYLFKHGNKANKFSANAELELENISGMSGHIHRTDVRYKTTRSGTICWTNVGHLSDVSKQGYTKKNSNKSPNWNQGFGWLIKDRDHMYANPILIDKYKCMVEDKVYSN